MLVGLHTFEIVMLLILDAVVGLTNPSWTQVLMVVVQFERAWAGTGAFGRICSRRVLAELPYAELVATII